MSNTNILIQVGAMTAGATKNLHGVTDQLDKQKKLSKSWGRSMFSASNIAKAGYAAVGLAALGAAKSMIDFGKEAVEDKKQADNLANTLGTIPGVTQKMIDTNASWIDSMELATNIADTDLRNAMSRLSLVTGDVAKAQELVALAADVSVGRNISLAAATKLVEKAATGHTESLKKQMPWLDANKDGAIDAGEAIEGLGKAYEGAAEKAADNDPWKRLQTIWGQIKEALGQWLIPYIDKFGKWFKNKENQAKIQEFINKMADFSETVGEDSVNALQDFYKWLKSPEGKKALKDLKDILSDTKSILDDLLPLIGKLSRIQFRMSLGRLETLKKVLDGIKSAIQWIIDHVNSVRMPSGGGGGSWGTTSSSSALTAAPTGALTSGARVTINLVGSGYAYDDARVIKRVLEGYDKEQGRAPGAPLRKSW